MPAVPSTPIAVYEVVTWTHLLTVVGIFTTILLTVSGMIISILMKIRSNDLAHIYEQLQEINKALHQASRPSSGSGVPVPPVRSAPS